MTTSHELLIKIQLLEGAPIPRLVYLCTTKTRWSMGSGFGREGPGQKRKYENGGQVFISYHVGMVFGLLYLSIVEGI